MDFKPFDYHNINMNKTLIILICFLLLAGWGCGRKEKQPPSNIPEGELNGALQRTFENNALSYKTKTIGEDTGGYLIEVNFPDFTKDYDHASVINDHIKEAVNKEVNSFLKSFREMDHEYDPGPWFLGYEYRITRNDKYFLSVVLDGSIYTGGAHPIQNFITFVFNLVEGGQPMDLEDFFDPFATIIDKNSEAKLNWLEFVSNRSRLDLMNKEYADSAWINSGAGPIANNFKLFYLTDTEIYFIFPPYQVAAYAAGPHEVAISYDDLAEILKTYEF